MLETIKQTIKTLINFRTAALLTVTSIPAVTIAAARGNRYALEAISYIPGGPQALKFIINNKILEGLAAVASVATASLGYYAFKQYLDARSYIRRYKNGEIKGPSLISDAARSPVAALHTHVDRIHKSLGDTVTFFTDRDRTLDVVSLGQFGHLVKTTVANDPMQIVLLHAEDADTLARAFGFLTILPERVAELKLFLSTSAMSTILIARWKMFWLVLDAYDLSQNLIIMQKLK
ncbi:MAG: hypothetical protein EBZ69_02625 [Alphaproteobacteria bacterium]|nr:hypothetical protein [Alphaproteobacteria bacterium]